MQERADRTREVILRAAAAVFVERGYLGTRLEDVVRDLGISKGALYFHFPSKAALAVAVISRQHGLVPDLIARLRPVHRRAVPLLVALSQRIATLLVDDVEVRAGIRLMSERNLIGPAVPRPYALWVGAVEELLHEAHDQGDLRPGTDIPRAARVVVSAFAGLPQVLAPDDEYADAEQWAAALWRMLLPRVAADGLLPAEPVLAGV